MSELEANKHELKTRPDYYEAIITGLKTFEIRYDDRGFKVGDILLLREWNPQSRFYTGRSSYWKVNYITNWGQPAGQVVMAIVPDL